jgi:hypothetical protein
MRKPPMARRPKKKPQSALTETLERQAPKQPGWRKSEFEKGAKLDPTKVRKPTRGIAELDPETSMASRRAKPKYRKI